MRVLPQEENESEDYEVFVISCNFLLPMRCQSFGFCAADFVLLTIVLLCPDLMRLKNKYMPC